mgnify:CR=1 FL=1
MSHAGLSYGLAPGGDVSLTVRFGGLSSKVVCLALRHEAAGHVRRLERMAGRQECRESVCDAVALAVDEMCRELEGGPPDAV